MPEYSEIAVEEKFAEHIRKFWLLDNSGSALFSPGKHALPNGCVTIAFISGNNVRVDFEYHYLTLKPGIYLVGQISKKVAVSLYPYTKAIMAQLNPWMPSLITKLPFDELADNAVSLEHINKNLYSALNSIDISDEHLIVKHLYKELESYPDTSNDTRLLQFIFNKFQIDPLQPQLKVSEIALHTGFSVRYIEQKFKRFIGLSPKEMQEIVQLRSIINEMAGNHKPTLSHLAHKYGYFDQSHFIKSYYKRMLDQPAKFNPADYMLPLA